ncbi:unnamed protein product [Rotaria sp. Silwood2]|nr:unnamed protein product [Rotaria sp. Silwood2]CAF4402330.1 unnamed protein product [Rotaria sp. Silwood2]
MQTEKAIEYIIKWLKDYQESSHTKGFTLGVSGGINSAVVSTLSGRTGSPVFVIKMPIQQSTGEIQRSRTHINWLKANFFHATDAVDDLTEVFKTFEKPVKKKVNLYDFASIKGYLVVGTGNKVEDFDVGFFVKYVRAVDAALGVAQEIIKASPTDDLLGDIKTDEEQIGASYDDLKWAMNYLDSTNTKQGQMTLTDRQKQVLDIYTKRHAANLYKMVENSTLYYSTRIKSSTTIIKKLIQISLPFVSKKKTKDIF